VLLDVQRVFSQEEDGSLTMDPFRHRPGAEYDLTQARNAVVCVDLYQEELGVFRRDNRFNFGDLQEMSPTG